MTTEIREQCALCGSPLLYRTAAEDATCSFCGRILQTHILCPKGHVLCDDCHGKEGRREIETVAATDAGRDPLEIAGRMMSLPSVPMLSCDHAYIAAGALFAALRNSPYGRISGTDIQEVFDRIKEQARGGYCGLTGVCGIAPAVGAVFSVFLGAHCGTDREQRIVMDAVTRTMRVITELTGPSCCKAYVWASISAATEVFTEAFGIVLPHGSALPVCTHSGRHPHGCREERCPYYHKPSEDIFVRKKWAPGTVCLS